MTCTRHTHTESAVEQLDVSGYRVPTDFPESDGTLEWDHTTVVIVEAIAGGVRGLGYTYADTATAHFIRDHLGDVVRGRDAMAVSGAWTAMLHAVRNLGHTGVAAMAVAAVDSALWDLKARLLELPLVTLLGAVREGVPVYGSGGFTSYSVKQLQAQLGGWVTGGIPRVKMKIGRDPDADVGRVRAARAAIGPTAELFVDANGAYSRKQALAFAEAFTGFGVHWFEEPVSSDDLDGLRLLRRMLDAGAVDVLQADVTRCAGISGFLRVGALCEARGLPLSGHTAPSLHAHPCCALPAVRHLEYFHDHVRIEQMFFEGALTPANGALFPDLSRPGMGLVLKRSDAQRYAL